MKSMKMNTVGGKKMLKKTAKGSKASIPPAMKAKSKITVKKSK